MLTWSRGGKYLRKKLDKMEKDEVNFGFDLIFKMRRILLSEKISSENNVFWGSDRPSEKNI